MEELEKAPDPLSEEALRGLLDLVIPDIVDEVYRMLEFDDLPTDEDLVAMITDISGKIIDEKLKTLGGGHIILDHLPTMQTEIDTFTPNDVVVVYNPNNPYIPAN